ncbi:hypothetical protein FOA52_002663 [Chlamydomonas sp. UWO 241]|nr:hypothetical protein FOA52_002663 [Chlamydomonas sp. UWO 241]
MPDTLVRTHARSLTLTQAVCAKASARMRGVGDGAAGQAAVDYAPEGERPALACALACLPQVGDTDGLAGALAQAEAEATALQGKMADEREERSRWHADNVRRRHNYVPFMFNTLRLLAKRGQLGGLVKHAKSLAAAKAQAAQQAQAQGK